MPNHADHPLLSAADEAALGAKVQAGDAAAREALILHNRRLALHWANKWAANSPASRDDLVQVAMLGLITAVDKFDPCRKARFSTMATWWINAALRRFMDEEQRLITLPVHVEQTLRGMRRHEEAFAATHGRMPTDDELWAAVKDKAHLRIARQISHGVQSLDAPLRGDDDTTTCFGDLLPNGSDTTEQIIDNASCGTVACALLAVLTPRERAMIALRFGLDSRTAEPRTLDDIGQCLGITRERVRQVTEVALRKMRAAAKRRNMTGDDVL
jgi:RNA polymerase primary sigma factor